MSDIFDLNRIKQEFRDALKAIDKPLQEENITKFNEYIDDINTFITLIPTHDLKELNTVLNNLKNDITISRRNNEFSNQKYNLLFNQILQLKETLKKFNSTKEIQKKVVVDKDKIKKDTKEQKNERVFVDKYSKYEPTEKETPKEQKKLRFAGYENIYDIKKIRIDRNNPDNYNLLVTKINDLIENSLLEDDPDSIFEYIQEIKSVNDIIDIVKKNKQITNEQYLELTKKLKELDKILKENLEKTGTSIVKDKLKKHESKFKAVKSKVKEKKYLALGGLLSILTDSPLFLIAGQWLTERKDEKRDEIKAKKQKEKDLLKEFIQDSLDLEPEDTPQKLTRELPVKRQTQKIIPGFDKGVESLKDIENIVPIEEKSLSKTPIEDDFFKDLLGDLESMSKASAKELGLDEAKIPDITDMVKEPKEIKIKEPIQSETPKNIINIPKEKDEKISEDDEIDDKEDKKLLKSSESTENVLKKYIPYLKDIDSKLEKSNDNFSDTYSEEKQDKRDKIFKTISENLLKSETIKTKTTEEKSSKDGGLGSSFNLLKMLAIPAAAKIGWEIGKSIDKALNLSKGIQAGVDFVQPKAEDYHRFSMITNLSTEQIKRQLELEDIKSKLGLERFTGKESYKLVKEQPEKLQSLTEKQKSLVMKKSEKYKELINTKEPFAINNEKETTNIKEIQDKPVLQNEKIITTKEKETYNSESSDKVLKEKTDKKVTKEESIETKPGVNIEGLNPKVKSNLINMSKEYKEKTGKPLIINSAKRSKEDQKKLYEKYPDKAAPPGLSMHEFGYAVDIDRDKVNELDKLDLLAKNDFVRPVQNEPWHLEPKNLRPFYGDIRKGITPKQYTSDIGDSNTLSKIRDSYFKKMEIQNNKMYYPIQQPSNTVLTQNKTEIKPKDFQFYIDDPYLRMNANNGVV